MDESKSAVKITVSYAKQDQASLDELKKHLSPLQRNGDIDTWDARDILAGMEWSTAVDTQLKTAHIILLLVSADFIASDYCYGVEMKQALARHEKGDVYVLPIILRPIEWKITPFGKLRSLPSGDTAIMSKDWPFSDEAFADVFRGIKRVVEEVKARLPKSGHIMKLFTSYSLNDRDAVFKLVEKLRSSAEYYIWADQKLVGDELWWNTTLNNIGECECFVLFLTPDSTVSVYCLAQLQYALALRKTVLPLILKPCAFPDDIKNISCVDIRGQSLADNFSRIKDELATIVKNRLRQGYAGQMRADRPPLPALTYAVVPKGGTFTPPVASARNVSRGTDFQIQVEKEQKKQPPVSVPDKRPKIVPEPQGKPVIYIARDGKSMRLIPASSFLFADGQLRELLDFYIDTCPVTNAEYQRFLLDQNVKPPATWPGKKFPEKKADHPVTGVSWYEAVAYATWAGKRLPTAVEWEKAARGTDGRLYPWGNMFNVQYCNTLESGRKATTPVAQYQSSSSIYGVLDMAGNVWEWTTDEVKPRGMGRQDQGTKRVLKGGSWQSPKGSAECASSTSAWPQEQLVDAGFRCVLS